MILRSLGTCLAVLTLATPASIAQTPKVPTYQLVSFKLNKSGSGSWDMSRDDRGIKAENVTLAMLLEEAYAIPRDLITGIPPAVASARFDMEAKIVDPDQAIDTLDEKQEGALLLPILAQRLHLKAHTETKILPDFDLVVFPGGPKIRPTGHPGPGGINGHTASLEAEDITTARFADYLTRNLKRTVIDKTGLPGNYSFALQWSLEDNPGSKGGAAPSLLAALQNQLGLKLQPSKGPVEVLVVDQATLPSTH